MDHFSLVTSNNNLVVGHDEYLIFPLQQQKKGGEISVKLLFNGNIFP